VALGAGYNIADTPLTADPRKTYVSFLQGTILQQNSIEPDPAITVVVSTWAQDERPAELHMAQTNVPVVVSKPLSGCISFFAKIVTKIMYNEKITYRRRGIKVQHILQHTFSFLLHMRSAPHLNHGRVCFL
jgi:hypothetical protein